MIRLGGIMSQQQIIKTDQTYQEFLIDESKYQGFAESISFPVSEAEILAVLAAMREHKTPVTIQGGKTGLTGAAVPLGGHVMNLSRMDQCKEHEVYENGTVLLSVEPGINLIELKKEIGKIPSEKGLFWPPDPTETSATVGGIVASGAGGLTKLLYGSIEKYVESIRLITSDGNIHVLRGKDELANVIGREGITGIISQLTLKLVEKPDQTWGISFFFNSHENAEDFVDRILQEKPTVDTAKVAAIEYMDRSTIDLIEARKEFMSSIKELPDIESEVSDLVYFELQGEENGIEELAGQLMALAENHNSDSDKAWAVSGEMEIERMHAFRHAAAETANLRIEQARRQDQRITKLGADMTLNNITFGAAIRQYRQDAKKAKIKYCIFGHAAGIHLHVNLLPESYEEYRKGIKLLEMWARITCKEGHGTVVSEHGIGKLKKTLFRELGSKEYLEECKMIKHQWDPIGMINRGNIFDWKEDIG